jgi:lysophospholipase L1-like esterase
LRPKEKSPGVLRIATMGDSSTFGYGLCYDATYSAQLEALLKSRGVSCEVLDFGVVGYTVRQGLERYTRVVREYKPDIVVEAFGAVNDHHQAQVMADKDKIKVDVEAQGVWLEAKTYMRSQWRVFHLFAKTADMLRGGYYDERDRAFKKVRFEEKISAKMGEVDFETKYHGTRRVSLEDFKATLLALRDEVTKDGGRLVMLNMPRLKNVEAQSPMLLLYTRMVLEIAASESLPLADGRKAFAEAVKSGAREPRLYVKGDSYHPSQDGHALLAAALAEQIQGLVPAK